MSKRAVKKAQETLERIEKLDADIAGAIASAQAKETERDAAAERYNAAKASRDGLDPECDAKAEAAERARLAYEEVRSRQVEFGRQMVAAEGEIAARDAEMMAARERAQALVVERRGLDSAETAAKEKLAATEARRAAYQAREKERAEPECANPDCVHCKAKKAVNVSPIKIDAFKGIGGLDTSIKAKKQEAVGKFQARMQATVDEREGVVLPPPPESLP